MLNNRWCEFVLNEGIMPPSLARLLKSDKDNSHNAALFARILQQRESFTDSQYPEITDKAKTAFLSDEETTKWLKEDVDYLLTSIAKNADSNKDPDLLNASFSHFINDYPLVKDEDKKKYLLPKNYKNTLEHEICQKRIQNKPWKNYNPGLSTEEVYEFTKFLENRNYRSNTIKSYCSIINKLNRELDFHNIWDIEDAEEMTELYEKLKCIPFFIDMNKKSHNILFCSLKLYIKFLDNRANKK